MWKIDKNLDINYRIKHKRTCREVSRPICLQQSIIHDSNNSQPHILHKYEKMHIMTGTCSRNSSQYNSNNVDDCEMREFAQEVLQ
mmetsp:Transcript_6742/g.25229  ORF Transcript_6742/g.25229 Transcript_6742/m.25229 type:complete len:85 (+) Transcript_6742:613-867(+)